MLEFFLRYPLELYRSGELLLASSLPPYAWWLLFGLAIAFSSGSVFKGQRTSALSIPRKLTLATLQLGTFALLALLLAEPVLRVTTLKPGANTVLIAVDDSRSMSFADGRNGTRLAAAREIAAALGAQLSKTAAVEYFRFADAASRLDDLSQLRGDGATTRLRRSLADLYAGHQNTPLAAVIVISDGADIEGADANLFRADTPLHTVGIGPLELTQETLLADLVMPQRVPVGSQIRASVTVRHGNGERALIRVRDGSRLLAARQIALPAQQSFVRTELSFPGGREGIRDLVFEVVPEGVDSLSENNQLRRLLSVVERSRRVMYLEGEPRWEYKFLRRALEADQQVELKSYLKITDRKSYRQGVSEAAELANGLPVELAELYGYDLIILGSIAASELSELQHDLLQQFVAERGGSLLVLAGRKSLAGGDWDTRPLAELLPVSMPATPGYAAREGQARPARLIADGAWALLPDVEGADSWGSLPSLVDYQPLGDLKPAARTIIEFVEDGDAEALPLLVTQPYGLGQVAVLASASTWRWQMRTPETDDRHGRFWRSLVAALAEQAPEPVQVDLQAGQADLSLRVRLRDEEFSPLPVSGVRAETTAPDGSVTQLELQPTALSGEVSARLESVQPGVHQVVTQLPGGEEERRFVRVGGGDREFQQPVQNAALLQRLARDSGGAYWTPESVSRLPEAIRFASAGVRERELLPLWNLPLWLALLISLKLAEWLLRRHWGRL